MWTADYHDFDVFGLEFRQHLSCHRLQNFKSNQQAIYFQQLQEVVAAAVARAAGINPCSLLSPHVTPHSHDPPLHPTPDFIFWGKQLEIVVAPFGEDIH